jgi:hypothetical protein
MVLLVIPFAQAHPIQGYGLKLGIGITNLDHEVKTIGFEYDNDNRIGLVIGAFVEWFGIAGLSAVTEARYFQKGMTWEVVEKNEYNQDIGTNTLSNRLDYLSVSALGKYTFNMPVVKPYLLAGPRLDFFLGYNAEEGWDIVFDEFEAVEYGADFGLGTELHIVNLPLMLAEFRYNLYFGKAYETDSAESTNRSFEILLGIKF